MVALTEIEKCAGRWFRDGAESVFAAAWALFPASAECSPQVRFFRHECPAVKGRTRAVRLEDMTLTSPEIWVYWNGTALEAVSPQQAQQRLADGVVVEYEQVLAGKFSFTWKQGKCRHCGLSVISREGVLKDVRAAPKIEQGDLAIPGVWPGGIQAATREMGL
jgi:hypothetical protein